MSRSLNGSWVAIHVRVNHERAVAKQLALGEYESFAPTYLPTTPGKRQQSEKPLFPGYLFCRYKTTYQFRIIDVPWVIRIVGVGSTPCSIPEHEIGAIKRVVDSRLSMEPWPTSRIGERVRVCAGPLAGLEGTLIAVKSGTRLLVGVTLLQRYLAVEVGHLDVVSTAMQVGAGDPILPLRSAARPGGNNFGNN
jgi:transcription antitermination factor NusG